MATWPSGSKASTANLDAGTVLGRGVALITCGNYYRFIKVPV